jgi:Spy/CpxP family protein refolding chaperone
MRTISIAFIVAGTLSIAYPALAQHQGHSQAHGHGHDPMSPYAEMVAHPIKSLSGEQINDLSAGRGMGLSLPAELNGYPGPKHVLELADPLGLSAQQRQTTTNLIESMSKEAIASGTELIALEVKLEALFADRSANEEQVRAVVDRIGATQAALRYVHLKYHLAMRAELTPEQTQRYATLRGYVPSKK